MKRGLHAGMTDARRTLHRMKEQPTLHQREVIAVSKRTGPELIAGDEAFTAAVHEALSNEIKDLGAEAVRAGVDPRSAPALVLLQSSGS